MFIFIWSVCISHGHVTMFLLMFFAVACSRLPKIFMGKPGYWSRTANLAKASRGTGQLVKGLGWTWYLRTEKWDPIWAIAWFKPYLELASLNDWLWLQSIPIKKKKQLEIIFPSWSGKPKQTWNILKPNKSCNHLPARHFLLGSTTPFFVVFYSTLNERFTPVTPWLVAGFILHDSSELFKSSIRFPSFPYLKYMKMTI